MDAAGAYEVGSFSEAAGRLERTGTEMIPTVLARRRWDARFVPTALRERRHLFQVRQGPRAAQLCHLPRRLTLNDL